MTDLSAREDHVTDSELIRRLREDDPRALRKLLDRYWDRLVVFAGRMSQDPGDAEDRVQETFARLWARRRALKDEGSPKALLYTMVRNGCLDELRRESRRQEVAADAASPPSPRTPWEDVQGAELQRAAAAAVAALPARRRDVFRLVREEGLSYQEVAEIMELAPQTVANHMSLAMADLRTALKPFLPSSEASGAPREEERKGGESPPQ